jgi:hypothetical protein
MTDAVTKLLGDPNVWAETSMRCHDFAATRADEGARVQMYVDALRRLHSDSGISLRHAEEAV